MCWITFRKMSKFRISITCVVPVYTCLISFRKFGDTYTIFSLKKQSLNICTLMFIAVLVTIAKRQSLPKLPHAQLISQRPSLSFSLSLPLTLPRDRSLSHTQTHTHTHTHTQPTFQSLSILGSLSRSGNIFLVTSTVVGTKQSDMIVRWVQEWVALSKTRTTGACTTLVLSSK